MLAVLDAPIVLAFLVILVIIGFVIWLCWRVLEKAGLAPALAFLCFVPYVGIAIVLAILAFSPWPNSKLNENGS
jgi:hypothetical protein